MKLIQSAFLAASLLALNAYAQPTPPPAPGGSPQSPNRPFPPPGARPSSPQMPPGLMQGAPKTPPVMPDKDKLSYAIGVNVANSIKRDELDIDVDTIAAAMKDVLASKPTRFNEQQIREIMTQFQGAMRAKMQVMREKQQVEREKEMKENKAKGDEFLAKNAKDAAVKSLPNGLQYKVLKEGTGDMPKPTDIVTVSYKGSLVDGTVFDQNEHFTTPVTGRTIKGWSQILPLMKTGSKWEVVIPADLGYGTHGFPPKIGPEAVLIFDMELLSVTAGPPPMAKPPGATPDGHAGLPPSPNTVASTTPVVSGQIIKVPSAEDIKKGAKVEVITNVPASQ